MGCGKSYVRTIAVRYAQKKTKIKRQILQNVENQIEILESKDVLIELESEKRI